jgi:hypothetical protein
MIPEFHLKIEERQAIKTIFIYMKQGSLKLVIVFKIFDLHDIVHTKCFNSKQMQSVFF